MRTTRILPALILITGCLLSVCQLTKADLVWDEGTDGDLSNFDSSPTWVILSAGANSLANGTVGGTNDPNVGDGFDVMAFTIGVGLSLDSVMIDSFVPTPGNTATGINLFQIVGEPGGGDDLFLGSIAMTTGDVGQNFLDLSGIGPVGPGNYTLELREFSEPGQVYGMTLNLSGVAVPEPASLATLVLISLAGFSRYRRRRR